MIIFRIEDFDGQGAYRNLVHKAVKITEYYAYSRERHPDPYMEKESLRTRWFRMPHAVREKWYFGFYSINQMTEWFNCPKFRNTLNDLGGCMALYKLDGRKIIKGDRQIIFRKDWAELVERVPIP